MIYKRSLSHQNTVYSSLYRLVHMQDPKIEFIWIWIYMMTFKMCKQESQQGAYPQTTIVLVELVE